MEEEESLDRFRRLVAVEIVAVEVDSSGSEDEDDFEAVEVEHTVKRGSRELSDGPNS